MITLIAALSENRVIGRNGDLPWRLPDDLRRFKRLTTGHPVIMGRRTCDTLLGPLPDRTCVVVTRDRRFEAEGFEIVHDLDEAIAAVPPGSNVFVIGGGEIYRALLPRADRMELTIVHADVEGDVTFPEFDDAQWREIAREEHPADERHEFAFSFVTYERVRGGG